jgi:hypothetical protein
MTGLIHKENAQLANRKLTPASMLDFLAEMSTGGSQFMPYCLPAACWDAMSPIAFAAVGPHTHTTDCSISFFTPESLSRTRKS